MIIIIIYICESKLSDREYQDTQQAMRKINDSLPEIMADEPQAIQERLTNALLNIAVHRLIHDEGPNTAASILWRLVDAIENEPTNNGDHPIELNQLNA